MQEKWCKNKMAIAKYKKRFFDVEIPLINKETQLQAFEIEELQGRFIKYDLSRLLRGKSMMLQTVIDVKEGLAVASPKQLYLIPNFLKRVVRKGSNYVEDSFSTETKDAIVRIKPFLVTRRKVSRAVRKALRNKAKEELISYLKSKDSEEVFTEILRNNLQKQLSFKLKKIYPLSACEIKDFKIEKVLNSTETKKTKEKPAHETKEEAGIETSKE